MNEIKAKLVVALFHEEERLREKALRLREESDRYLAAAKIVERAHYEMLMFNGES